MDVVVGLILNDQGQVLVARRGPGQTHPQKLEFPGGKINPNEPHFDALVRELQEELGIVVRDAEQVLEVPYDYPEFFVRLYVWRVLDYENEPYGAEGQEVFWISISDISLDEFLHGNTTIIDFLISTAGKFHA